MISPYIIFVFPLFITIIFYNLKWSLLYPPLTTALLIYLMILVILMLIIGLFFKTKRKKIVNINGNKKYVFTLLFILAGTIINGLYSKGFPLFGTISYLHYGAPTIAAFVSVFASFTAPMAVKQYLMASGKKEKIFLAIIFILSFIPFVMALSRGMFLMTLATCFIVYTYIKGSRITIRRLMWVSIIFIVGIYAFGIVGNYRLDAQVGTTNKDSLMDSSLIQQIGEANTSHISSDNALAPFFWGYLYLTSPLANLQSNINNSSSSNTTLSTFILNEFVPDVVSKRINNTQNNQKIRQENLIVPELNVGTIFFKAYSYLGWGGIFLMSLWLIIFPIIYLMALWQFAEEYYEIGLAVLCVIYALAVFDNLFTFSGLSVQLILPFIFKLIGLFGSKEGG